MASHPDPDVLAEHREGLLSRRRAARIRSHLTGCAHCTALDADLAEVSELLASAPPPRMPDHLVTRLESALAAESAARGRSPEAAAHPAGPSAGAPGGGTWRRPARDRGRPWQLRPATLGVAAAVAAVLALGGYGLAHLHTGGASSAGVSSPVAGGPAHGAAGTAPLNGKGVIPNGGPADASPLIGQLEVIKSGTDYLPGQLASQARAVLARQHLSPASQVPTPAFNRSAEATQSCVSLITHDQHVLVDEAHYQGQPATIIIQPAKATAQGQVWVVAGSSCSATDHNVIAHTQFASTG
jgi:hypothetical protein